MKRFFVDQPLRLSGNSFLGLPTKLEVKPHHEPGIWWEIPSGEKVCVRDAVLDSHKLFHYMTLKWRHEVLRIPEHLLGLFFAIGIDGICIIPHKSRLPYDGCAKSFWKGIKPALSSGGMLGCYTPDTAVEIKTGTGRSIRFSPDETAETLTYQIGVEYEGVGDYILTGSLDTVDIEALTSSRPYGRTMVHNKLSRIFLREHQYVWFQNNDNKTTINAKLGEIALHRLLDLLGALMCISPPNGRLVGKIVTQPFVGHSMDLLLLNSLRKVGLKRLS